MVVFSYKTLREFADLYPLAADSLNTWYLVLTKGDFAHFHELREVFNSVDAVGNDLYVFNIKGNQYRFIAGILFNVRTVYIKFVGTHSQYDHTDLSTL
ncbi:MAG: type II toxin-antitoxin system HigB family toxin [Siphonobacter aquaeclarae]|nr:type II toxin-antitoxin system HigB family toxin [Siphonobacter aquaeclarae]